MTWRLDEVVGQDQGNQSLRSLLEKEWLLPRRFVHYLRARKQVLVDGEYRPVNTLVQAGQKVTMTFSGDEFRTAKSNYRPTKHPRLAVVFENRDLLVVNKPAGQKSHPNQPLEGGTLMNDVAGYLEGTGNAAYMVHRLDQETSGAMIVAKNPVVVPILDRRIANGEIHRHYLAVVSGHFESERGTFTWPIGRDPLDKRKRMVNGMDAKAAKTFYQVLTTGPHRTLVALNLATGRTHQLRVHLKKSGHPIVGDPLYGSEPASRMMLHGVSQEVILPFSNLLKQIQVKPGDDFLNSLVK